MADLSEVRPSPIAGMWYSGEASQLSRQVDRYLAEAQLPALPGEVIGVIAPHAGHRYSGRTAGHAFRAVQGQEPELVVIFSPFHALASAPILTSAHRAYATPLGPVEIDRAAQNDLAQHLKAENLNLVPIARDGEHSLEIELPFLQRALPQAFRLLPVMVHSHSDRLASSLGRALAQTLRGRKALLVASTDLSHFYPEPVAQRLDAAMLRGFESYRPDTLFELEERGEGFACGLAAVAAILWASHQMGGQTIQILHHSTSADETGDRSSVVGYGAAAILKPA